METFSKDMNVAFLFYLKNANASHFFSELEMETCWRMKVFYGEIWLLYLYRYIHTHTSDAIWYFSIPDFTNLVFFEWFGLVFNLPIFSKKIFSVWYSVSHQNPTYLASKVVFNFRSIHRELEHSTFLWW